MATSLQRAGLSLSHFRRSTTSTFLSTNSFSSQSDALTEVRAGEIGIVSGIPDEHLNRRVVIYSPARVATQQGAGKVGKWKINFLSTQKWENPLMGWTSTGDPYSSVGEAALTFDSEEAAKDFAKRNGWHYELGITFARRHPMIPTYASLLELCCATKNLQKLRQLHSQTIKLGISYNDFIRAKLISSYVSCAQMADAHLIFKFTNRKSTFLYNTLIRGYASSKQFDLSLAAFHEMLLNRKPFDLNTLPAILKSVAALSALRLGRQVHNFILVNGLDSDLAHCNALISMYGKCGDLYSVHNLFDRMPERNLITWCAMMGGHGMRGNFDEVLRLFDRMLYIGVLPDGKAFTTVLTACSHGGMVEKGKEFFDLMVKRYGLKPSMEHYTCMVDMLSRAGRIEEAKGFVDRMDMKPDEAVLRALLKPHIIQSQCEIT